VQKIFVTLLVAACLSMGACSDVYDVSFDYDEKAQISGFRTFDWMPLVKKKKQRVDEITYGRVQDAVVSELGDKGLSGPVADPDVLIQISFGAKGSNRRTGRRSRYRYKEGYLHIEMVDPETDGLVWIGSAKAVLGTESSPENSKALIGEVVGKILEQYPPPESA